MTSVAGDFQNFLPAIIFLVACFISFATGTSWGTFGILIPIVIAIFPSGAIQTIGMSACLAGSVCGDHCSPISDTTIMSSAGGQCNHLNHVSTQLPYAISVAAISFVMYIVSGFVQKAYIHRSSYRRRSYSCIPLCNEDGYGKEVRQGKRIRNNQKSRAVAEMRQPFLCILFPEYQEIFDIQIL